MPLGHCIHQGQDRNIWQTQKALTKDVLIKDVGRTKELIRDGEALRANNSKELMLTLENNIK